MFCFSNLLRPRRSKSHWFLIATKSQIMPETRQGQTLPELIAAKGFRLTAQRKILLEVIQHAQKHLDATTILKLARRQDPAIHRATVYRALDLLKRLQLIDELDLMHLEGEKHFYETRTQFEHFHLACVCCGRIVEHSTPTYARLKHEISEQTGFSIDVIRLEVGGKCPSCRAGKPEKEEGPELSRSLNPG
jgi:Fur family ferric uptake transcriptional regulator